MNKNEAVALLDAELVRFREQSYDQLVGRTSDDAIQLELNGATGVVYQLEIRVFWDDPRRDAGNIRVAGAIDDGGWRPLVPLTRDFIKAPDGSFVGEQHRAGWRVPSRVCGVRHLYAQIDMESKGTAHHRSIRYP